jgi:hypothetical protein
MELLYVRYAPQFYRYALRRGLSPYKVSSMLWKRWEVVGSVNGVCTLCTGFSLCGLQWEERRRKVGSYGKEWWKIVT